jgi:hypothetical protein
MKRALTAFGIVSLALAAAHAAMPPGFYRQARKEAPYHAQVVVTRIDLPAARPDTCVVVGEVVRVFRDAERRLRPGMALRFPVSCLRGTHAPTASGTLWFDVATLRDAQFIEVYLVDAADGFALASGQLRPIKAPSSTPQFPID